ncbi:MmgE/PrpD family protein [Georgenia sp. 10Sc9-8]|uniref:MmgE/PrpD family protein n=1 Tax=Georgenia halotolerans TaxID=3028317 RepID=A0ABT5U316_9MICO|nr:MmgE/PrpD family protein [Georgenia halotolerans]
MRSEVVESAEAREATKLHVLDTLAAVISGRVMPVGDSVARWLTTRRSEGRSSVVGEDRTQHPEEAAFVNAMCAHADESDDSHEPSRSHPGASIVPTAIAVAEHLGRSGPELLDAVALGYEACALMNWLTWSTAAERRRAHASPHGLGGLWGSAVTAGALHRFDDEQMRSLIAYTGQLAGGLATWLRDEHHVEKALVFSGSPAWHAVRAAELVAAGWPGVRDTFDGEFTYFTAFGREVEESALERASAARPIVEDTNIKKYCVGSPAQAAVQAAEELRADGLDTASVAAVRCCLPVDLAYIVDQRDMTNINVQYLVARTLVDGTCTFAAAHDEAGVHIPEVADVLRKTTLVADDTMEPIRQARLEVDLADGSTRSTTVFPVRGTKDDPMTRREVESKADDLLSTALSQPERTSVIDACREVDGHFIQRIGVALRAAGAHGEAGR